MDTAHVYHSSHADNALNHGITQPRDKPTLEDQGDRTSDDKVVGMIAQKKIQPQSSCRTYIYSHVSLLSRLFGCNGLCSSLSRAQGTRNCSCLAGNVRGDFVKKRRGSAL